VINVVLFEPEIPQNTGNIMRTCAGTGVMLHLIEPLGFKLDDAHIKRSGVNYIEHCNYKVYSSFDDFMSQNDGEFYFFTRYGHKPHTSFDFSDVNSNIYLVFGKESTGIPKEILKEHLDRCMRIPMNDNIRALNLSNSVAVGVFEVLRQQNYRDLLLDEPFKGKDYLER
jgi:tRNA (cytidine/uridine-2'-O-)-methyltransferase